MPIQISVLGGQSVSEGPSGAVTTRSSRTIALVAYLAVHSGSPQSRPHIAGLFWPDSTDAQALTNLRRELHFLRRALADAPSLLVTAKDLHWRDVESVVVDVRIFEVESAAALAAHQERDPDAALRHAEVALAQYRGDLLPGLYDDWVLEARADLQRRCVELCALVSELRSQRGDHTGALEAARRRIRLQPLEEVGYRVLIELQADQGDRAGAISTYHRCASLLERELGVRPSSATRAALQRVVAEQVPLALQADRPGTERPGPAKAELVGRARELELLREVWRTAGRGRPSLAVVRGGAGVGKTRLIEDVADTARQDGGLVAGSQCFGTSGRLALAPVADWLRSPAVQSGTAALEPVWREEVQRLVPSPNARGDPAPVGADVWPGHRFFEGLARALVGAGRPILLTLDNLQWCDQESLTFLTFLLKLIPDAPVLVLCTLRTSNSDDEPGLADWITRMRATGLLTEVTLHPLDALGTARLAEAIAGRPVPASDHDLLQAATGGFPLHIVEAMRAQPEPQVMGLPTGDLTVVLRHRLEQVSPQARDVAGLAAAVGRDFTLDLLVEASDLEADHVVNAVDELWRARLVQEHGDGYDFSHDLVRDAAYAQVSPPRRWLLHRRLAQGLELVHAEDLAPVTAQLAEQYARGGRPERAVTYYRRAATMASSVFAHAEAIRLYSAALSIVRSQPAGRDTDQRELALLEAMAAPLNARFGYSSPRLQEVLDRSIGLAESLGRTESTLSGLVGLWACRYVQGMVAESHAISIRTLDLVGAGSERSGSAHFAVGGSTLSLGRPVEALRHFEIATRLTRGAPLLSVGTRPEVHTRAFAAHAHWLLGHDGLARASSLEAIDRARSLDHQYSLAVALSYAGITQQMRSDRVELLATVTELRELCGRYGFGYYREWGLILEGWCRGGEAGVELARRGINNLKSEGSFARMPYWLALLAELQAATGRPEAARATLDAAVAGARARSDVWWLPEVERMRAHHANTVGVDADRLRAAAKLAAEHGSVALLRRCRHDLAEAGLADVVRSRSAAPRR
jgi:DNA-binding SARP family transcriptional activator